MIELCARGVTTDFEECVAAAKREVEDHQHIQAICIIQNGDLYGYFTAAEAEMFSLYRMDEKGVAILVRHDGFWLRDDSLLQKT